MNDLGTFPFGQQVRQVVQKDRSPKRVFILGFYASAVHACWLDAKGRVRVKALAVASEPEIFWNGTGAESIVNEIFVPTPLGKLIKAGSEMNGPSGRSLDEEYLLPLGITRNDAWLCDINPFAHMNTRQQKAINNKYRPHLHEYNLPEPTLRPVPRSCPGKERLEEIWSEFMESLAEVLILLGDKPIQWFFSYLQGKSQKLSDFGKNCNKYGRIHSINIRHKNFKVLPLVHPRQASKLGASSPEWTRLHKKWKKRLAGNLLKIEY